MTCQSTHLEVIDVRSRHGKRLIRCGRHLRARVTVLVAGGYHCEHTFVEGAVDSIADGVSHSEAQRYAMNRKNTVSVNV